MPSNPNILFFMVDQMRGEALRPESPCQTPHLDALASRGIRFDRAYTTNAVCSPARASLMTGLLPHNHGVTVVTHTVDDDQANLRTHYKHWAQHVENAGYNTGYFGKWHVERSNDLTQFGWQTNGYEGSSLLREVTQTHGPKQPPTKALEFKLAKDGYNPSMFYSVIDTPPEQRGMGTKVKAGMDWLDSQSESDNPWCCFISVLEPHDPFVCSKDYYDKYDVDNLTLPANLDDDLANAPGMYRKSANIFAHMTDREKREAAACYYASITEIDALFGKLIAQLESQGELDNTLIVFTSDHGELLGSHGLYTKNVGAYEEVYHIPMVVAGPGVAQGQVSDARVGIHDLAPTLTEYVGQTWDKHPDSRSFMSLLSNPDETSRWQWGYAEFSGGRYLFTQRVYWDGPWKLVHNGFDVDELYNLDEDPCELNNRINDPACTDHLRRLMHGMWQRIDATGDHSLLRTHYPPLRLAPIGPELLKEGVPTATGV